MIVKFALIGLMMGSAPSPGMHGTFDWKVVSSHDTRKDCETALEVFEGMPDTRDLQCVKLRRSR